MTPPPASTATATVMGVGQVLGNGPRFCEQRPDQSRDPPVNVPKLEHVARAEQKRVQCLATSSAAVKLDQRDRRNRDHPAASPSSFNCLADLTLMEVPRVQQGAHGLGVENQIQPAVRPSVP